MAFTCVLHHLALEEAPGHSGGRRGRGGDLLYRWGNPSAWGASGGRQLYLQHGARWVSADRPGAGHIVVFDNGDRQLRAWSRVVEIAPPLLPDGSYARAAGTAFGPAAPDWQWTGAPPQSFYATHLSSAQRLPSGDTLVCDGPAGRLFELEPAGTVVWQQTLTSTAGTTGIETFRADRYELSYPGLAGRDLTPRGPLLVRLDARNRRHRAEVVRPGSRKAAPGLPELLESVLEDQIGPGVGERSDQFSR